MQSVSGVVDTKLAISDFNTYSASVDTALQGKADASALADKLDISDFNTYSGDVDTELQGKQATLTAGNNIDITNNVISVTGSTEITIDDELSPTSTNPVVNSAITSGINSKLSISDFNTYSASVDTAIASKADASALTDYVETTAMTQALADKVDVSAYTAYTSATDTAIASKASEADLQIVSGDVADKADSTAVVELLIQHFKVKQMQAL